MRGDDIIVTFGRSPHGERGLKYEWCVRQFGIDGSLSSWRAWIEMECRCFRRGEWSSRSPHGERGLKSEDALLTAFDGESLSSWRAWIEIQVKADFGLIIGVALLMESVD